MLKLLLCLPIVVCMFGIVYVVWHLDEWVGF